MKNSLSSLIMKHRLPFFVCSVIVLAITLVGISMSVYYSSDAFRLDLSRPEYLSLRSQIDKDAKDSDSFEAIGGASLSDIDDFLKRYKAEETKVMEAKAFSADVLSDEQLNIASE